MESIDHAGNARASTITLMELWEGIHRSSRPDRERPRVEEFLKRINERPVDREIGLRAGEVSASLISREERVQYTDLLIGVSALVDDVPVVTRNVDDFERIDGLEIVTY